VAPCPKRLVVVVDGCVAAVDAAPCPKRVVVGAAAGVAVGVPKSVF
jgi:hypothetical protein